MFVIVFAVWIPGREIEVPLGDVFARHGPGVVSHLSQFPFLHEIRKLITSHWAPRLLQFKSVVGQLVVPDSVRDRTVLGTVEEDYVRLDSRVRQEAPGR